MMTGMGVSVGGAGMLRARRRDVSIKPNRRLDRKSSRGMIYENEELRMRTINMNAEVEQGQNDIKKLQRENKQLRREIWSLRDEYDKLEEILKNQKNCEGSDESEGRSGEDDDENDLCLDYSDEEGAVEEEEEEEGNEEQLENAENQKISSEKMSNGLHRFHVDFDDLSVVDEEEEPKKDKDIKDVYPLEEPRQDVPTVSSYDYNYPFVFQSPTDPNYPKMLPIENPSLLVTPCTQLYATPLPGRDSPLDFGPASSIFGPNDHVASQKPIACGPPIGWQSNVVTTQIRCSNQVSNANQVSGPLDRVTPSSSTKSTTTPLQMAQRSIVGQATFVSPAVNLPTLPQRRNVLLKQSLNFFNDTLFRDPSADSTNSGDSLTQNGWDFSKGVKAKREENASVLENKGRQENDDSMEPRTRNKLEEFRFGTATLPMTEKPRHFFAPLPSKIRQNYEEMALDESPTAIVSTPFGTGTSSSSSRTNSTVISRNQCMMTKGSADIYVNGAFPMDDKVDQKTFLSTENLLINETRKVTSNHSSSNPLIKSQSCQDLSSSSDPRNTSFNGEGTTKKLLTKSDNTLDNISNSSRPFKSHLNVTLKLPDPRKQQPSCSPNTPEIPKLPSVNYKLFNDPFLFNFEHGCPDSYNGIADCQRPISRPLSIQMNETDYGRSIDNDLSYSSPFLLQSPGLDDNNDYYYRPRGYNQPEDLHNRLLMAANQSRGNGIAHSPVNYPPWERIHRITSFEGSEPRSLLPPATPFDRREPLNALSNPLNSMHQIQRLYQNVPQGTPIYALPNQGMTTMTRLYYNNVMTKVPAQTQTSPDMIDPNKDSKSLDAENPSAPSSPATLRRRKILRKECRSSSNTIKRPLSPAALRRRERLRKQNSVTSSSDVPDSPKTVSYKSRKPSATAIISTPADMPDKLNENRSSSSGQDSPKKDQTRRMSIYFNAKKRPSLTSRELDRSGGSSVENSKDRYSSDRGDILDSTTTNSDREKTNSVSSRETIAKERKMSGSSGKVPWCACWGNGCV